MVRKRTCTRRCWNAKCPKCRCICGGINHGEHRQILGESNPDKWIDDSIESRLSYD